MAPKHPNPMEDPPTASSSDEEEEVSMEEDEEEDVHKDESSSDEDGDDDGDHHEVSNKKSVSASAKPAFQSVVNIAVSGKPVAPPKQASDSDSGSETETDSDSETERRERVSAAESAVKPVVAKPVEKNRDSVKAMPLDALASSTKSTAKRPINTERPINDVKRVRKEAGTTGEDTKKTYFQRLWSEDDEIAVLKGIIDFKSDTGVSPFDDINGFYELAKKSISFDVSKNQFMDKIRSLRKKYMNNLGKGKNGEDPSFIKPHDRNAFDLSKTIWGPDGMAIESAMKSNGKSKKSQKGKMKALESLKQELFSSPKDKREDVDAEEIASFVKNRNNGFETMLIKAMAGFGVDELAVKQGWAIVSSVDKKKIEEKWHALRGAEIDFLVQKSEFIHEASKMIAETFRSSR